MLSGNVQEVSRSLGIPDATIQKWKGMEWWETERTRLSDENQEMMDASLTRIIHKAHEELEDRITNGDEVIAKDGERLRKAMTGRDLATVGGITFDKRQILRNQPTSIRGNDGRLNKLFEVLETAGQFAIPIEGEVIPQDS